MFHFCVYFTGKSRKFTVSSVYLGWKKFLSFTNPTAFCSGEYCEHILETGELCNIQSERNSLGKKELRKEKKPQPQSKTSKQKTKNNQPIYQSKNKQKLEGVSMSGSFPWTWWIMLQNPARGSRVSGDSFRILLLVTLPWNVLPIVTQPRKINELVPCGKNNTKKTQAVAVHLSQEGGRGAQVCRAQRMFVPSGSFFLFLSTEWLIFFVLRFWNVTP